MHSRSWLHEQMKQSTFVDTQKQRMIQEFMYINATGSSMTTIESCLFVYFLYCSISVKLNSQSYYNGRACDMTRPVGSLIVCLINL